jgi:hypothetical protein
MPQTDVAIVVHVSDTVTGPWTTNIQPPIVTDDGNGLTETVRIQDSVPMTGAGSRFLRVRVVH